MFIEAVDPHWKIDEDDVRDFSGDYFDDEESIHHRNLEDDEDQFDTFDEIIDDIDKAFDSDDVSSMDNIFDELCNEFGTVTEEAEDGVVREASHTPSISEEELAVGLAFGESLAAETGKYDLSYAMDKQNMKLAMKLNSPSRKKMGAFEQYVDSYMQKFTRL